MSNTPQPNRMRAFLRMVLWVLLAPLMMLAAQILGVTPLMAALPLPYAIWMARGENGRYAILPLILLMAALGAMVPTMWALALFMLIASVGLYVALRPGRTYYQGIAMSFASLFAASLGAMTLLFLLFGDPISLWINSFAQHLHVATPGTIQHELMVRVVQADLFMQDASVQLQTVYDQVLAMPTPQLVNHFTTLLDSVVRAQLPLLVIQYAVLGGVGCYAFGTWWLGRDKKGLLGLAPAKSGKLPPLQLWSLPASANWGMLLLMVTAFILSAVARSNGLITASSVIYQLATMVFSIIGLATLDFFLVRRKAALWLRIVAAVVIALFLPMVLSILGIMEQLFHVRLGYRLRDAHMGQQQDRTSPPQSPPQDLKHPPHAPSQQRDTDVQDQPKEQEEPKQLD